MTRKLIIIVLALLILTGCTSSKPKIAYTVYPVEFLLKEIAGDTIEYENISEGSMILRAKVKPNFKEVLSKSDLLIYFGGLEPYMQVYSKEIEESKVSLLDITARTNIYQFNRYTAVSISGSNTVFTETKYYENPIFNSIDVYSNDPYLWMDPLALTSMAKQIKEWLVNKYPEQTPYFEENYLKLEYELALVDTEYQQLKSKKHRMVTMTPSFGPWQQNYHIEVYPVILSKYGVLPTTQQLNLIKQRILTDEVRYIVEEPNMPEDVKKLFDSLVTELNLTPIKLSNLATRTEEQIAANKDYIDIMYDNLLVLEGME